MMPETCGENATVPAIEVRHLEMGYGSFILMQDISFTVEAGQVMVIMGGSGCGKSTLLKYLIGLKEVEKGEICYQGRSFSLASEEERERIQRSFGVLYQAGALWSTRTLAENIALPLEQYTDLSAKQIREIASLKLSLVGLKGFEDFYPSEISGGMRKRAGLAPAPPWLTWRGFSRPRGSTFMLSARTRARRCAQGGRVEVAPGVILHYIAGSHTPSSTAQPGHEPKSR